MNSAAKVDVYLCPPTYPRRLHPFNCVHNPQFNLVANGRLVHESNRPGAKIELDSPLCLACGAPLPGTFGGNVIGCIKSCLHSDVGLQPQIRAQLLYLSQRYLRIAARLFDADGWTGRHRKWAVLIDPNLTMRVVLHPVRNSDQFLVEVHADESYFKPQDEPWPFIAPGAVQGVLSEDAQ